MTQTKMQQKPHASLMRLLAILWVIALVAAACGGGSEATTTSAEGDGSSETTEESTATTMADDTPTTEALGAAPPEFTIQMVGAFGSPIFALMYVADGIGAFEEEIEEPYGIPVVLQGGLSSGDSVVALAAGEVESTGRGFVGVANALVQGAPVHPIGTYFEGLAALVVADAELEDELGTDFANFSDLTFGTGSPGGVGEIAVRGLSDQAGIDFDTLETVPTDDPPVQRSLMESGDIQVVAADTTTASQMVADGLAYVVFNTMDPEQNQPIFGKQLGTFILVGDTFEADYPEFARAFYRALAKGWQAIDENRDDAQAILDLYSDDVRAEVQVDAFLAEWPQVQASVHPVCMCGEYLDDTVSFAVDEGLLTQSDWDSIAEQFDGSLYLEVLQEEGVEVVGAND